MIVRKDGTPGHSCCWLSTLRGTVSIEMPLEVVRACEPSVADLTSEGPLACVLSHVSFEVVLQVESAPTNVAHKGTFLRVSFDVAFQLRTSFEGEVAASALELRVGMCQYN